MAPVSLRGGGVFVESSVFAGDRDLDASLAIAWSSGVVARDGSTIVSCLLAGTSLLAAFSVAVDSGTGSILEVG